MIRVLASLALSMLVLSPAGSVRGYAEDDQRHDRTGGHHHGDEHGHEEGIELSREELDARGISLETAGPRIISRALPVNAKVVANNDTLAHLHPRFSGILTEVKKQVGERVTKGEVMAVVESNQSLQRYEVRSLTDGTVVYRHATLGEFVGESQPIFVVADLSKVWVDLHVFPRDFSSITVGQRVRIRPLYAKGKSYESTISFTSAVVDEESQARIARAVVENSDGLLLPDQYVSAEVALESYPVKLAVHNSALQRVERITVVFVRDGHALVPRTVVTGRSDSEYTEILSGLRPGVEYARGETFILKAELGKGSAAHEH